MRNKMKLPAALLALSMVPALAGQVYTKEEAVRVALEKSSDIKEAEETLISARSQVDQGFGSAYPTIDLSATYARTFGVHDVRKSSAVQDMLDDAATDNEKILASVADNVNYALTAMGSGYRWGTSVGLTATQILYAAGQISSGIDVAKAYEKLTEISLESEKETVRFNVENSFDQLIYLDSSIVIIQASIDQVQANLDYVIQAKESGLASELDVIRAQLSLEQLKSTLANTEKNRVVARNSLLNTMGLPWDSDVSFTGDLIDPSEGGYTMPDTNFAHIRERRKELKQLEASEEMYEHNITLSKAGYKPTVVLGGSITYADGKNRAFKWDAPDWDDNISKQVYLNVSMNLFNGMSTREGVVQAKSNLRTAQIQKESAERGIKLEVESAVNTFQDAIAQIEIQKGQVDLAQRNYDLTEAAYKVGRETQLNLLDASTSLRSAKLDYMSAIVTWNNAYNTLRKATGEF